MTVRPAESAEAAAVRPIGLTTASTEVGQETGFLSSSAVRLAASAAGSFRLTAATWKGTAVPYFALGRDTL